MLVDFERLESNVMNCDIGLWPNGKLSGSFVGHWVERGSHDCQHIDASFSSLFKMTANKRGGFPDLYFLVHILLTVRRFHVHGYAIHLRLVVHFALLASCWHACSDNNSFAGIGYCDWKNAACRIEKHENSQSHRVATLAMFNRSEAKNRVDNNF